MCDYLKRSLVKKHGKSRMSKPPRISSASLKNVIRYAAKLKRRKQSLWYVYFLWRLHESSLVPEHFRFRRDILKHSMTAWFWWIKRMRTCRYDWNMGLHISSQTFKTDIYTANDTINEQHVSFICISVCMKTNPVGLQVRLENYATEMGTLKEQQKVFFSRRCSPPIDLGLTILVCQGRFDDQLKSLHESDKSNLELTVRFPSPGLDCHTHHTCLESSRRSH